MICGDFRGIAFTVLAHGKEPVRCCCAIKNICSSCCAVTATCCFDRVSPSKETAEPQASTSFMPLILPRSYQPTWTGKKELTSRKWITEPLLILTCNRKCPCDVQGCSRITLWTLACALIQKRFFRLDTWLRPVRSCSTARRRISTSDGWFQQGPFCLFQICSSGAP